jgi:RNA polymerase-binding transcription factor DksA
MQTGGDAAGNLSSTPLHLGDLGSDVYTQELNATLLENEEYIRAEALAAIDRIDAGTFGTCENCGATIPEGRLEILPYARYCVRCAEELEARHEAGKVVNLNDGRPMSGRETMNPHDDGTEPVHFGGAGRRDSHAVGIAGGGTAIGGLAGTNTGSGDPIDEDLVNATASGNFDAEIEGTSEPNLRRPSGE